MIEGRVNNNYEAVVPLEVRAPGSDASMKLSAVVDTGYSNALVLPLALVERLGLQQGELSFGILADGRIVEVPSFEIQVLWHGKWRRIIANGAGLQPLIGTRMIAACRFTMDLTPGGLVTIAPL
jgi:clan AA aspartic protease